MATPIVTLLAPEPGSTIELSRVSGYDSVVVEFEVDVPFVRYVIMANGGGGHDIGVEVGAGGGGDAEVATSYAITAATFEDMQIDRLWRLDVYVLSADGVWSDGQQEEDDDVWKRPSDRPAKPQIQDNMIVMLFGVEETSPNDIAFLCNAAPVSGNRYHVDWGDGTSEYYSANSQAEHMYDYATLDKPVSREGYKFCWITITPENGDLTQFNSQRRPSRRPSGGFIPLVLELYIECPSLAFISIGSASTSYVLYGRMDIFSLGPNKLTGSANGLLGHCVNLRKIEKLHIEGFSTMASFMYNCYAYNQPFPENVAFNNVTSSFMNSCYAYNQPFPENVAFNNITTGFMNYCRYYSQPLILDLSQRATALSADFPGTVFNSLKILRLLHMTAEHGASINISNSNLDVPALVSLFGDLADRNATTPGTITITSCFGASMLSASDRAIATGKNWTIVE